MSENTQQHNTVIFMFPTKYMQKERTTLEDTFVNELISYHLKYPVLTNWCHNQP